jgi:hypothetical protein
MRITTECPHCGRVELGTDDLTVVVNPLQAAAWYVFDCRTCVRPVFKAAPSPVVNALARLDVTIWTVPAEIVERGEDDPAINLPAFGVDEILDAILWLRTHDHLDASDTTPSRRGSRTRL